MQTELETSDLLLATHFPNSTVMGGGGVARYPPLPAVPNAWTGGWLQELLPIIG
jgi:hypothetical protein